MHLPVWRASDLHRIQILMLQQVKKDRKARSEDFIEVSSSKKNIES
jgi:hypothetical protein